MLGPLLRSASEPRAGPQAKETTGRGSGQGRFLAPGAAARESGQRLGAAGGQACIEIQRALRLLEGHAWHGLQINHRGLDVAVAQQVLDRLQAMADTAHPWAEVGDDRTSVWTAAS